MGEDIACDDHVGLISIHGEPVNPQELRQQCVAMALHDELRKEKREENEWLKYMRRLLVCFLVCDLASVCEQP